MMTPTDTRNFSKSIENFILLQDHLCIWVKQYAVTRKVIMNCAKEQRRLSLETIRRLQINIQGISVTNAITDQAVWESGMYGKLWYIRFPLTTRYKMQVIISSTTWATLTILPPSLGISCLQQALAMSS